MLLISLFVVVLGVAETHGAMIPVLGSQVSSSSVFTFGSTNFVPQLAVDGGFGTDFIADNTTFATAVGDTMPYMDIDLGSNFLLVSVTITNRGDCCADRLRNIRVEVYNNDPTLGGTPQVCTTIGSTAPAASSNTTFTCSAMAFGRYIRFNKFSMVDANDILQFVEVVLDGVPLSAVIPVGGSQVSSSSVFTFGSTNFGPQLAVDGGFGPDFVVDNTTFGTAVEDTMPYMDIDLGSNFLLRSVTITNRADCCSERLRNIIIEVHDNNPTLGGTPQVCTTIGSTAPAAGSTTTFNCTGTPIGRYIRLKKSSKVDASDILQLVEVVLEGVQLQCPCNHFQLDENCFYFSGFQASYADAKEYCDIIGSNLAMIRTQAQSDFVNGVLAANAKKGQEYWIGVTNLLDRFQWRYLLGDIVPLNGFTSPLVNGTGTCSTSTSETHPHNCAVLEKNDAGQLEWEEERCYRKENFICLATLPIPAP
ncbi:uncharacterized protein LOC124143504 [Haliotis rufescens]|uniref:uncharacterized protein LOC124143504 n=1 Tax=Haliotis rufescens TaxID=6454 RepID=UPI001EAF9ADC|nr:uncharacterized protein LOC124143504 [Haliotis rufescens]